MWNPRPLAGDWTADQARVASHFPHSRRVCVTSANGVGKTHLAADLAVTFLLDFPSCVVLTTAPTRRQVEKIVWPQIWARLDSLGLSDLDHSVCEWRGVPDRYAYGFATNQAQRLQGFHKGKMLVVVDEASGMTAELLEAIEGVCVGAENYVFAIGNPNEPVGPFWEMSNSASWVHEQISALTHPNILERREVVPGATTWRALTAHLADWCRVVDAPTSETFTLDGLYYLPNDAFRVRFLGLFPRAPTASLFQPDDLREATTRTVYSGGRVVAALDVARMGGDRTVYSLRRGYAVVSLEVVEPGDLPMQAESVLRRLMRDDPETLTCDAAGLGIGLVDYLRRINVSRTVVREFNGAGEVVSPLAARRYLNRRAQAYGSLSVALQKGLISLPPDSELLEELGSITYSHKADGRLVIVSKEDLKAQGRRSPDLADVVAMLWDGAASSIATPVVRPKEVYEW
jgi:hypothetical protein